MPEFTFQQPLRQLEKRKGGYYYLQIDAEVVEQFNKKRATRLKCVIDQKVTYSCGLNHLGDGNFYLIIATRHLKTLDKQLGDLVSFKIYEDPNPLGVEIPEVLSVLLAEDPGLKAIYDTLTDGKKRTLIYTINRVKNVDLQVQKVLTFLEEEVEKRKHKKRKRN